jgi:hypothetical protein
MEAPISWNYSRKGMHCSGVVCWSQLGYKLSEPCSSLDKQLTNSVAQEPKGSSPHSQQLATGPYPQPVESDPHLPASLPKIHFDPNLPRTPWSCVQCFVAKIEFYGKGLLAPAQPPNWRTTHCQLFTIAYSIYSLLPSISGFSLLYPQPEDAPCRGDSGPI